MWVLQNLLYIIFSCNLEVTNGLFGSPIIFNYFFLFIFRNYDWQLFTQLQKKNYGWRVRLATLKSQTLWLIFFSFLFCLVGLAVEGGQTTPKPNGSGWATLIWPKGVLPKGWLELPLFFFFKFIYSMFLIIFYVFIFLVFSFNFLVFF
jgi:hypothetical protein